METTLTNVNAYENAVRTQAGAADIRAQLLDSLAKSKAVVDSVFGKIEEIDRMKAESEQLRKKISTVIPGKATMLTMLSVLSLLVFGLFGAPVVLSIFRVTDPGTIYLTFILVPTVPFVSILLIRSRVVKEARAQEQADFMRDADLLDSRIQADFRQITAVLESDRGIYAKNHIPEDYFYPEAVAMFQYYIRNGQADSMKEALREYDQYLHRCRLEYQATRAASASERSASAAERTAARTLGRRLRADRSKQRGSSKLCQSNRAVFRQHKLLDDLQRAAVSLQRTDEGRRMQLHIAYKRV